MEDWNRKVTILGLGRSGLAAAKYLSGRGADVLVSDSAPRNKDNDAAAGELDRLGIKSEFGGHSDEAVKRADVFVVSPGIPPRSAIIKAARRTGRDVISDIEVAFRDALCPMIAITGTNGKSTTTALISYILENAGRKAPACGNIGTPILSLLADRPDFLVCEVSSFQLEYSPTFAPFISIWLNLTPDHLDWHANLDEYISAKRTMFAHQHIDQYAVLNTDDSIVVTTPTVAEIMPFSVTSELDDRVQGAYISDGFVCCRRNMQDHVLSHVTQLGLKGKHNLENVLAATAATIIAGADPVIVDQSLKSFKGLEHRLEYVETVKGVAFYNDSKATNTVSAIKALEAFSDKKVVLIAGGKDKGTSLQEFVHVVRNRASAVILIGEATDRFKSELNRGGVRKIHTVGSLTDAVKRSLELALELDQSPVLFSPACASFDMFKNYEERGRVFKDIVRERLKEVASPERH